MYDMIVCDFLPNDVNVSVYSTADVGVNISVMLCD